MGSQELDVFVAARKQAKISVSRRKPEKGRKESYGSLDRKKGIGDIIKISCKAASPPGTISSFLVPAKMGIS